MSGKGSNGGGNKDKDVLYYALGGAAVGYFLGPRLIDGLQPLIGAAVGGGLGYMLKKEMK